MEKIYENEVKTDSENRIPQQGGENESFIPLVSAGAKMNNSPNEFVQRRAERLYKKLIFIGNANDGLTQVPGSGTLTRNLMTTVLVSGTDSSTCSLYSAEFSSGGTALDETSWDFSHEFIISAGVYGALTTYDIFFGSFGTQSDPIPDDATSVVKHIGFFITDSDALYCSNGDGATQSKTQITGITLDQFNIFRYEYIAGKEINFYINDIFVAKHTTNLPSGTDSQDPGLLIGVEGQGDQKTLHISNNYSVVVSGI